MGVCATHTQMMIQKLDNQVYGEETQDDEFLQDGWKKDEEDTFVWD